MALRYSAKWASTAGDTFAESGAIGAMWQATLAGVTATQIGVGMQQCALSDDEWPPTPQAFRKLCFPPVDHSHDWQSARPDPLRMPSAARLAWHQRNVAWIKSGRELPRPDNPEPPAPAGCIPFWNLYLGITQLPDPRAAAERREGVDPLSPDYL